MYVHVYMHMYVYVCAYTCIYVYVCLYVYICVYLIFYKEPGYFFFKIPNTCLFFSMS